MSVDYRPGLPTTEQVKAHEERGGWWMSRFTGPGDRFAPQVRRLFLDEKRQIRASEDVSDAYGMAPALIAIERRPCSPDGDPMPWPGEPSEGIDSLRKALSISDERVREQAGEIERLTAEVDYLRWETASARHSLLRIRGLVADETAAAIERDRTRTTPQQTTEGKRHAG